MLFSELKLFYCWLFQNGSVARLRQFHTEIRERTRSNGRCYSQDGELADCVWHHVGLVPEISSHVQRTLSLGNCRTDCYHEVITPVDLRGFDSFGNVTQNCQFFFSQHILWPLPVLIMSTYGRMVTQAYMTWLAWSNTKLVYSSWYQPGSL